MRPRVSIVGAGPAGFALAADLERHGTDVLVYSHPAHFHHADHVIQRGVLRTSGVIESSTQPLITQDMSEIVKHSKTIALTVPSSGQETILQLLKGFRLHQHIVIAMPGNLISLLIESKIEIGHILETNLSPYSCRMNQGDLSVMGKKRQISIAGLPSGANSVLKEEVQQIFPIEFKWCHNILEVCLSNINGVLHPPMMLMNAGRVESTAGEFGFYRDGLTRSVANAILAIDQVRLKIGEELGFQLSSVIEVSNECYGQDFADLVDLAQNSAPHNKLKAPPDLDNRNFSEDVADLLVCWQSLAEKLGIDASPIKAVIVLVEMATGIDYMKIGRNLQRLNLDKLSRDELIQRFGIPRKVESSVRRCSPSVEQPFDLIEPMETECKAPKDYRNGSRRDGLCGCSPTFSHGILHTMHMNL